MKRFIGFLILVSILGEANAQTDKDESKSKNDVYIVYMGASTWKEGAPRTDHVQLLNEHTKRKNNSVLHIYNRTFSGHAVRLSPEEATLITKRPGVVSVFPDSRLKLHTTRFWDFLMSQNPFTNTDSTSAHSQANVSSSKWSSEHRDTIIGIIDSGIWSQHPSFDDKHMGPIPKRWNGVCMTDVDNSTAYMCNRKIIGARYYDDPEYPGSITTAMDMDGHGSHVSSIAAGSVVNGASYYGLAKGVARGGSPYSRIAIYNVCGPINCPNSLVLKAFDDAIADEVDVISASMGVGQQDFFNDAISIGAFHAIEKGVVVVASVGNDGPSAGTVENYSPWILTVGATTMDRYFEMDVVLGGRNEVVIKGGGISFSSLNKSPVYQLVDGRLAGYNRLDLFNASHCFPSALDVAKVKGGIVLCKTGDMVDMDDKFDAMTKIGVVGVIMISNFLKNWTYNYNTRIAFTSVSQADGARLQSYINSTINPLATILPTETILNHKPAPIVSQFSSRGPAPNTKNIIKPDVTAPGDAVLGAWLPNDTSEAFPGMEPPLFTLQWGTSGSCPHVSGVAATVKSWNSKWTPSAIKSAIMTTAIKNNNLNAPITIMNGSKATPYDIGSGEISLFSPWLAGLVYETEPIDYILFMCNLGYNTSKIKLVSSTLPDNFSCPVNSSSDSISDMNYPSIAVSGLVPNVSKTVTRTVTNVGRITSSYRVNVETPADLRVEVVPSKLHFSNKVKKLSFQVKFILATTSLHNDLFLFGSITWSFDYNFYNVRSPFVVTNA